VSFRQTTAPLARLAALLLCGEAQLHAEPFGDIEVLPQLFFSGHTQRGYDEHRFLVLNRSATSTRQVTLVLPSRNSGWGTHLGRLSRTVTVGPGATARLSLWQPPIPIHGDHSAQVIVDGRFRGRLQNAFESHYQTGHGGAAARILVSPNGNRDHLERALKTASTPAAAFPHSPDKATGAPDAPIRAPIASYPPNTWAPDNTTGRPGKEWLELDFDPPFPADGVRIFLTATYYGGSISDIVLKNAKGIDIQTAPPPTHGTPPTLVTKGGSSAKLPPERAFARTAFPLTAEPVKTVRITFDTAHELNWVDAVQLTGGTNRAWATAARASSFQPGTRATFTAASDPDQLLRARIEPAQWSEHWLAYTAFNAVLLTQTDFAEMPESTRTALWRYTETGGRLVVIGRIEVPEAWRAREIPSGPAIAHHRVGFGECLQLDANAVQNLSNAQITKLKGLLVQASANTPLEWLETAGAETLNRSFPVVGHADLPVRGMALLMLAFVLVVGPINLGVLRAVKRPIWFLWTIPVLSVITCLIVLIYSLLSEGITSSTRVASVTLLDQGARRATTAALLAFYCPLSPGDGLRFSLETHLMPLHTQHRGQTSLEMDCSSGQHLTRGWVAARVPAHFFTRKSETRRERIQIERAADGSLMAVNGLGAPVKTLWLADAQGKLHRADAIEAGAKATLATTGETVGRGALPDLSKFMNDPVAQIPAQSIAHLKPWLRAGVYFAELEEAPFVESPLAGKIKSNSGSLVIGLLEPEALR
jgi:hypothetical protein